MGPRLTLNFGVRYEPYQLFEDELDRNQTFDLAANRAGIRSKILQERAAGAVLSRRRKAAGLRRRAARSVAW